MPRRGRSVTEGGAQWKAGRQLQCGACAPDLWTSLWGVHSYFPSEPAGAFVGRKNAAGPGIAQGAFVLRFPAIDKLNHNTVLQTALGEVLVEGPKFKAHQPFSVP